MLYCTQCFPWWRGAASEVDGWGDVWVCFCFQKCTHKGRVSSISTARMGNGSGRVAKNPLRSCIHTHRQTLLRISEGRSDLKQVKPEVTVDAMATSGHYVTHRERGCGGGAVIAHIQTVAKWALCGGALREKWIVASTVSIWFFQSVHLSNTITYLVHPAKKSKKQANWNCTIV